jgi:hypothetical protein
MNNKKIAQEEFEGADAEKDDEQKTRTLTKIELNSIRTVSSPEGFQPQNDTVIGRPVASTLSRASN